jgi:hypothetical protein
MTLTTLEVNANLLRGHEDCGLEASGSDVRFQTDQCRTRLIYAYNGR